MIRPSDIKSIKMHGKDTVQNSIAKIEDGARKNYFSQFPTESTLKKRIPNSFIINNPMTTVGGDGYWFHQDEDTVFLAVFDCMGHGHLASMMTRIYTKALQKIVVENGVLFPNQILFQIHQEIQSKFHEKKSQLGTGADFGMVRFNIPLNEMEFAGAKMNLFEVRDGELYIIKADRMQVGEYFDHPHDYKTVIFDLHKKRNSNFYLFSDGLKDLIGGPQNKKFGSTNLKLLLEENYQLSMPDQKRNIGTHLAKWQGSNNALDDVLLIGFNPS